MGRKHGAGGDLGELLRRVKDECGPEIEDCRDVFIDANGLTDDALKRRLQAPISDGLAMAYSETGLKLLLKEFGTEAGIVSEDHFGLLLTSAALTIIFAPAAYQFGRPAIDRLENRMTDQDWEEAVPADPADRRRIAVICGYVRVGRLVEAAMQRRG